MNNLNLLILHKLCIEISNPSIIYGDHLIKIYFMHHDEINIIKKLLRMLAELIWTNVLILKKVNISISANHPQKCQIRPQLSERKSVCGEAAAGGEKVFEGQRCEQEVAAGRGQRATNSFIWLLGCTSEPSLSLALSLSLSLRLTAVIDPSLSLRESGPNPSLSLVFWTTSWALFEFSQRCLTWPPASRRA